MPTTIKAKTSTQTCKGTSGNGRKIGHLLRHASYKDAKVFLSYLSNLSKTTARSPFSCAEPHAVAELLSRGAKLEDITMDIEAREKTRAIDFCTNCRTWINADNGSLNVELIRGTKKASDSETLRASTLGDFISPTVVPAPTNAWDKPKCWSANFAKPSAPVKETYEEAFPKGW